MTVLSAVYFDPRGLIVAETDSGLIGFVHVGFCVNADLTALDHSQAVICAIVVAPEFRQQGVGTALLEAAAEYALGAGASMLYAGPSPLRDPFYTGIYGGSRCSGFLASQPELGALLEKGGFEPFERHGDRKSV
ncbi:MAG: GNAT family N-acetyltransferase, partial [Planctomycetaceae bacterium]|nr:GNAT family N-acetyltransferase [Planctomycetaceae bacterium]